MQTLNRNTNLHLNPAMSNAVPLGLHVAQSQLLSSPVRFSLLCMYSSMKACIYFDSLKFENFQ